MQEAQEVQRHQPGAVIGVIQHHGDDPQGEDGHQLWFGYFVPFDDRCLAEPVQVMIGIGVGDEAGDRMPALL